MAYVTLTDLKNLLSAGDGTAAATSLSDARLQADIDAAQAEVDARLATRYQTPITVTPTPAVLARITLAYAAYYAMLDYRQTVDLEERDPYQLRYNTASMLLADIVAGRADLAGASPAKDETQVGEPHNEIDHPLFTIDDFDLTKAYFTADRREDHRGRWVWY